MDPISMASFALGALKTCRDKLEKAKLTHAKAVEMQRTLDVFEVTLIMIPSRGDGAKVSEMQSYATIGPIGGEIDATKDDANSLLENTSFGVFSSLITYKTKNIEISPLRGVDELTPAQIMTKMREDHCKDLDITFVGMSFIIRQALQLIKESIDLLPRVEPSKWTWIVMPWKAQAQIDLGNEIDAKMRAIEKCNLQLQNAVSVASYAISLEQLENVLNASNMLESLSIRDFWRRKIGIGNTKVTMVELAECFMAEVNEHLMKAKATRRHQAEQIIQQKSCPEVCLSRFLCLLWNANGDEFVSVYEINKATKKYGKFSDAITQVFKEMISLENQFYSKISFTPMIFEGGENSENGKSVENDAASKFVEWMPIISGGNDGIIGSADDVYMYELAPFDRLFVYCDVPIFDQEFFEYDSICLLKYDRDPSGRKSVTDPFSLEEINSSRTYINKEANTQLYGKDHYRWNAPQNFGKDPETKSKRSISTEKLSMVSNFEKNEIKFKSAVSVDAKGDTAEEKMLESINLGNVGIKRRLSLFYAPILFEPGYYSVRYCVDDVPDIGKIDINQLKKTLALSPKSYYYDKTTNSAVVMPKLLATIEGIGPDNFNRYATLKLGLVQVELFKAMKAYNATPNRDGENLKQLLLLKYKLISRIEVEKEKFRLGELNNQTETNNAMFGYRNDSISTYDDVLNPMHYLPIIFSPPLVDPLEHICNALPLRPLQNLPHYNNSEVLRVIQEYNDTISKYSAEDFQAFQDTSLSLRVSIDLFRLHQAITDTCIKRPVSILKASLIREEKNDIEISSLDSDELGPKTSFLIPKKGEEEKLREETIRKLELCIKEQDEVWTLATSLLPEPLLSAFQKYKIEMLKKQQAFQYIFDPKRDATESAIMTLSADRMNGDTAIYQHYYNVKFKILDTDIDRAEVNRSVKRLKKLLELKSILIKKSRELPKPPTLFEPTFNLAESIRSLLEKLQKIADERLMNEMQLNRVKANFSSRPMRRRSEYRLTLPKNAVENYNDLVIGVKEKVDECISMCKMEFSHYDACQQVKNELQFALAALSDLPIASMYKEPSNIAMQNTIENIKKSSLNAPFKSTSEESMLHTSVASDPTLGIIIVVRDEPALVWGQSFRKDFVGIPYEDDNIDDEEEEPVKAVNSTTTATKLAATATNSTDAGKFSGSIILPKPEVQKNSFRPAVSETYPFQSKKCIFINPLSMREDDDSYLDAQYHSYFQHITGLHNDETAVPGFEDRYHKDKFLYRSENGSLAIFYRMPKKATPQSSSTSPIPSEIGIFDNDDKFIGVCDTREMRQYIVDGRKVTYIVIDFGAMLLHCLSPSVASPLVYKFTVRFLEPVVKVEESAEKARHGKGLVIMDRKGLDKGPELVVCFNETTPMKLEIHGDDNSDHGDEKLNDEDN